MPSFILNRNHDEEGKSLETQEIMTPSLVITGGFLPAWYPGILHPGGHALVRYGMVESFTFYFTSSAKKSYIKFKSVLRWIFFFF